MPPRPRSSRALARTAAAALALAAASPALADGARPAAPHAVRVRAIDLRPMDDGPKPPPPPNPDLPYQPLRPENFRGTKPPDAKHDAETATGITVQHSPPKTERQADGTYVSTYTDLTYSAVVDEGESYNSDPGDQDLLKHEQGHFDLAELEARRRNRDKKAELDKLKGTGSTPEEAEADLDKKLDDHVKTVDENLTKTQKQYDEETDHSRKKDRQRAWDRKIETELKSTAPTGAQLESRSSRSVHYDAADKRLRFTDDVFTRVLDERGNPLPVEDALVGAELVLPAFLLVGETVGGDPFFLAEGVGVMTALEGSTAYFALDLPYLVYHDGMFVGLSPSTPPVGSGGSAFLADLRAAFDRGDRFLLGLRIVPDRDFDQATRGFTESASSAFTNGFGRVTSTPEPASAALLGAGMAALLASGRIARRRRHERAATRHASG